MPESRMFALVTITAAFQRIQRRIRRSRSSSPGNQGSSTAGMELTYGLETVAGKPTWLALALQQLHQEELGAGPALCLYDGIEGVQPLGRLLRVDVGYLV